MLIVATRRYHWGAMAATGAGGKLDNLDKTAQNYALMVCSAGVANIRLAAGKFEVDL